MLAAASPGAPSHVPHSLANDKAEHRQRKHEENLQEGHHHGALPRRPIDLNSQPGSAPVHGPASGGEQDGQQYRFLQGEGARQYADDEGEANGHDDGRERTDGIALRRRQSQRTVESGRVPEAADGHERRKRHAERKNCPLRGELPNRNPLACAVEFELFRVHGLANCAKLEKKARQE
jgi:hypothetical protein